MSNHPLELSREQILGHRRRANRLDDRLPPGARSLEQAALVGLQDSAPRAAQLSLHARVHDVSANAWEHPALAQVWGPRYSVYVVAAKDVAVFTISRLYDNARELRLAEDLAHRLHAYLGDRRVPYDTAAQDLGLANHNMLRYVAPTGTLLMRWEGARRPLIWSTAAPTMSALDARLELARRYLHVFGPTTANAFSKWAGISGAQGREAFSVLAPDLLEVRTPIGSRRVLASDEPSFRSQPSTPHSVRLLPSGDAYWLLWGDDRALLVPDPVQRDLLWTPRVWPGALLVDGEIIGTWRRANADLSVEPWRRLSPTERHAVEEEAASMPLPGLDRPVAVSWSSE